ATGKEQSMTITGQSSLDKDTIEQMIKDAEAHAEEDRRRREEAEVRNSADSLVYSTEKLLKEQGDKLQGDEKTQVEEKLAALKSAIGGTDVEAIKDATEALMTASQGFTQRLHEQAAASERAAGDAAASSPASDDDVVHADSVDEGQSRPWLQPAALRAGRRLWAGGRRCCGVVAAERRRRGRRRDRRRGPELTMADAPQDPEAREPTTPEATETDAAAAPEAAAAEGAGDAAASTEDATSTGDDEVVE